MKTKPAPKARLSAICWRSGKIELVRNASAYHRKSALILASGPARAIREIVQVHCRWAYDNKTMLVPGIPEADSASAACTAAINFSKRLREALKARLA